MIGEYRVFEEKRLLRRGSFQSFKALFKRIDEIDYDLFGVNYFVKVSVKSMVIGYIFKR